MTADYILAPNPSGLEMRTEINAIFSAILSQNSSATEPTSTVAGMFWYDTTTGIFKQRNSTNDGWVDKWDTTKGMLASLASPTFTGNVNLPSTSYIAGNLIASLASPTFTGTVTIPNLTVNTSVSLPAATSIGTVSQTEISYLDGVTSAIQTQLNAKQATLVSGTNIKTINGVSLLGADNIELVTDVTALFSNSQTFTASGTFTVPAGVTKVLVCLAHAGAGGGGGGGAALGSGGDGGGGSASVFGVPKLVSVTPSEEITVTIGAGGAGGAGGADTGSDSTAGSNGSSGGDTSFGSYLIAKGSVGIGGGGIKLNTSGSAGGGGGAASFGGAGGSGGASANAAGDNPTLEALAVKTSATGGLASSGGAGSGGTSEAVNGSSGTASSAGNGGAGGAGGSGKVIVYW